MIMRRKLLALASLTTLTGCTAMQPLGTSLQPPAEFQTKLVNLGSFGFQESGMTNYMPQLQSNSVTSTVFKQRPPVGALNVAGMDIINSTGQTQQQAGLIL
jgi:hypothetical protein